VGVYLSFFYELFTEIFHPRRKGRNENYNLIDANKFSFNNKGKTIMDERVGKFRE
jgi:hypothetical protein